MSNFNVDNNLDNNDDAIRAKLLGLEIENGSINYGIVSNFKYEFTGYETIMIALTDKGNEIDCHQLLRFMYLIDMKNNGKQIVYPDGTDYSNRVFGPQRKRNAKVLNNSSYISPNNLIS
jgi:hypothetical protein